MNRNGLSEATLLVAVAVAGWVSVAVLPTGFLRFLLTLPLVVWLPGYALLALVHRPLLGGLEGVCFAIGISLSATILIGYILNAAGALTPLGWASALAAVAVVPTILSSRNTTSPRIPSLPKLVSIKARLRSSGRLVGIRIAMFVLALGAVGAAFHVARDGAMKLREFKYTELWVVPEGPDRKDTLRIGVRNMEGKPSSYELELRFDGSLISQWKSIPLADGEEWTIPFSAPIDRRSAKRAEARLYKSDDPDLLYRQAWLNLPHN